MEEGFTIGGGEERTSFLEDSNKSMIECLILILIQSVVGYSATQQLLRDLQLSGHSHLRINETMDLLPSRIKYLDL